MKKQKNLKRADISKLKSECLGDQEYLNEIVALLDENIEEFYDAAEIYLKAKDRFSISRAAHKIKNGLEMIQAYTLLDYLDMIQKECQHLDTFKNIENLIEDFKVEYTLVQAELKQQISKIND
ncbi:hypothetical protein [Galbibacter sp. BG1]|uniref:hypothetical protein n=1 Tax=Galbibacter sp. BG1 TaxID=1170699 RepID=UPI00210782B1|nr:hypothetical protein [Galbibacter sp. BG1]